jgi:hypothetical protein
MDKIKYYHIRLENYVSDHLVIQLSYKPVDVYIHRGKYSGVASAASVITQFCRKKIIDKNATFLIHHARNGKKIIHNEDDIYFWMEKTGLDYLTIQNLVLTEPELPAETAYNLGFVDEINLDKNTGINNNSLHCIYCGKQYKRKGFFSKTYNEL